MQKDIEVIMENIKLVKIDNSNVNYDLLYSWCQDKNVYEWFEQRILTKEEIVNKYNNKLNNSDQTLLYIDKDNSHIGLVQFYKSDYEYENKNNIYEYDLFIIQPKYRCRKIPLLHLGCTR